MRRETQNVLLVLVGGVLIKIVLDGTFRRWVAPWVGVIVLAAGIVVVALALIAIARDLARADGPGAPGAPVVTACDDGCGDGHSGHGTWSAWLLLVPVLAILLVAPPALDSGALVDGRNRGLSAASGAGVDPDPLPPGAAPGLTVVDFVSRAAADPHGPLTQRDVTLTGFLAEGGGPEDVDLVRWVIACCAADASAVRVHLQALPDGVRPGEGEGGGDRWVTVRGRLVAGTGTPEDGFVPTFLVGESSPIGAPDPVYEY